jgi:hypothetical protein
MKEAVTKRVGPLPRWGWALIILALLLLYLRHRANQQASSSQAADVPNTDPYSSYATQGQVVTPDQQAAYGGAYPLSGGGSLFPPYESALMPAFTTDPSVPTTNAGSPMPPAQGGQPIAITINGSTGSNAHRNTKRTTTGKGRHHPATQAHTSTGGGQQNRHTAQHTKRPASGGHKTTSNTKLTTGTPNAQRRRPLKTASVVKGITAPLRTVARVPTPTHTQAPIHKPVPVPKPKPKPAPKKRVTIRK